MYDAGKGVFIWPILQDYAFLDLTPRIIDNKQVLEKDDKHFDIDYKLTFAIEPDLALVAAKRLLNLPDLEIKQIVEDMIGAELQTYKD